MESKPSLLRRIGFWIALSLVIVFFMFPLVWILVSSIKVRADVISRVPTFIPFVQFQPTLQNYSDILIGGSVESTTGVRASADVSAFRDRVVIAGTSTLLAVLLGTLAAYAFSRFRIPGENDLMFFILSTRMLPPIVVL